MLSLLIEKIKNNRNYCAMHLISFVTEVLNGKRVISVRTPIRTQQIPQEVINEFEKDKTLFIDILQQEWMKMVLTTPYSRLSKNNQEAKKQFTDKGITLSTLLKNPKLINQIDDECLPTFSNANGEYIMMQNINNIDRVSGNRTSRIYVSLATEKVCAFMKEFIHRVGNSQYYFKFYSATSADKVVIYPQDQDLFKICKIIKEIKKDLPNLFENADNKYFATSIEPGISLASDFNQSFSEATNQLLKNYIIESMYSQIDFNHPNINRLATIALTKLYNEETPKGNNNIKNISCQEFVKQNLTNFIDCVKNREFFFRTQEASTWYLLYSETMVSIYRILLGDKFESVARKLRDYNNLEDFIKNNYINERHPKPSINNLAFTDEEIERLVEVYTNYELNEQPES